LIIEVNAGVDKIVVQCKIVQNIKKNSNRVLAVTYQKLIAVAIHCCSLFIYIPQSGHVVELMVKIVTKISRYSHHYY